jgi:hypothetical protein
MIRSWLFDLNYLTKPFFGGQPTGCRNDVTSRLAQRPLIECAVTEGSSELLVHQFQKVALIYLFDFSVISDSEITSGYPTSS